MRDCCPPSSSPLTISAPALTEHQVLYVTLLRVEEVAVVVVRVARVRAVVTVVTTSVIPVTSVQTASMAGNRDKVVNGRTSTPATKDSTIFHWTFPDLIICSVTFLALSSRLGKEHMSKQ